MRPHPDAINIVLPDWLGRLIDEHNDPLSTPEARMQLALMLARRNIEAGGGPFGAVIFSMDQQLPIAFGVNLVIPGNCSLAHAEMVAIAAAQQRLGQFDLASSDLPPLELVSSAEPCAMCLGAIPWSGIRKLSCAARDHDVRAIGFDEGSKPDAWVESLEQRGIAVARDICRDEAVSVLQQYQKSGGAIYNGHAV